jgi:site-specific DNA-methyltransferase (adenine-specific)
MPYFSVDGKKPLTKEKYKQLFPKFEADYGVTNVWEHPPLHTSERIKIPGSNKYAHLNQKPLKLIKMIIEASSGEGDIVWEPFGGLCTAGLASCLTGRKAFCAEIDEGIFETVVDRFSSYLMDLFFIQSEVDYAKVE